MRWMIVLCISLFVLTGCAAILDGGASENVALLSSGAEASHPALTDGDVETFGESLPKAEAREFRVTFTDPIRVRSVRLVNHNLEHFQLDFWDISDSHWQRIKDVREKRRGVVRAGQPWPTFDCDGVNMRTDAVRITVSRTTEDRVRNRAQPHEDDKILRFERKLYFGHWIEWYRVLDEATARIGEVEVYASARGNETRPRVQRVALRTRRDDVSNRIKGSYPEFFQHNVLHSIPLNEIEHGGTPKDGIPALNSPTTIPAARAGYLRDDDLVLGLARNDEARAYPLKILNQHEIVNDRLGGDPVLVTYCPLCGTAIAFDPTVDGSAVELGVSGLLHNSDLLMYERGAGDPSLWQQALGEAVVGPRTGSKLRVVAAVQERWGTWRRKHPNTTVLSTETGHRRNYDRDPYEGYARTDRLFFPVRGESRDLPRKTLIFGLLLDGQARAYRLQQLRGLSVVHDVLGTIPVVLVTGGDDEPSVRAYQGSSDRFTANDTGLIDSAGNEWTVTESALVTADGTRLERIDSAFAAFWFAWSTFYPQTDIYARDDSHE